MKKSKKVQYRIKTGLNTNGSRWWLVEEKFMFCWSSVFLTKYGKQYFYSLEEAKAALENEITRLKTKPTICYNKTVEFSKEEHEKKTLEFSEKENNIEAGLFIFFGFLGLLYLIIRWYIKY